MSYFMIVGKDERLFELDLSRRDDVGRTAQFIIHAALDMVDATLPTTAATYLKVVDRHNEQFVSAYVTPGGIRFMLLHDAKAEEAIRGFCTEVHEAYIKLLLNPFYTPHTRIVHADFEARARAAARRYLGYKGE